jgi:hypothetical protein
MTLTPSAPKSNPPTSEAFRFAGFGIPNGTYVPDEVFDLLMPRLSDIELRALLYIIRRTFGFKKSADDISLKQMVEGITTRDGRMLDGGCGLSRPSVTKAVRGLAEKNIVKATANYSPQRGNEATTYTLVFTEDPCPQPAGGKGGRNAVTRGGGNGVTRRGRNAVTTQETGEQETERQRQFENSNDHHREKIVDNLGITGYLDNLIVDISREFGDTAHLASNCKQARNIFTALDLSEEVFVEQYVYQARQKTKHQAKVRNKMAYFFATLREMCGLEDVKEV